jgi:hypothetical protein
MTITVELKPEVEARLSTQAKARELSLDAYVQRVIEETAASEVSPGPTLEEFEAGLDALAQFSDRLPVLPPEMDSREYIYADDES